MIEHQEQSHEEEKRLGCLFPVDRRELHNSHVSLKQFLRRTINEGVPLFNSGDIKGCYELYFISAKYVGVKEKLITSAAGQLLERATDKAMQLGTKEAYTEAAWMLRLAFETILSRSQETKHEVKETPRNDGTKQGYCQGEKALNMTDEEIGQALSGTAFILRSLINVGPRTRLAQTFQDAFTGSEAVDLLTSQGLAGNRQSASDKLKCLLNGSLVIALSHPKEKGFRDGTHIYRFPDRHELQKKLDDLKSESPKEGSKEAQLVFALQNNLHLPGVYLRGSPSKTAFFSGASTNFHLQARRASVLSPKTAKGEALANLAMRVEGIVEIKDRTYHLRKYEKCFVGKDSVTELVERKVFYTRAEAVKLMDDLLQNGLIHHVVYDHEFKDEYLFYAFAKPADIKKGLDAFAILPKAPVGEDEVRHAALFHRYKQFAGLDVSSILNSFFGCETEEGWDLVDLQNWSDNMKRWGVSLLF